LELLLGLLRSMGPIANRSSLALLLGQLRIKAPLVQSSIPFWNCGWGCFAAKHHCLNQNIYLGAAVGAAPQHGTNGSIKPSNWKIYISIPLSLRRTPSYQYATCI